MMKMMTLGWHDAKPTVNFPAAAEATGWYWRGVKRPTAPTKGLLTLQPVGTEPTERGAFKAYDNDITSARSFLHAAD